jgi:hypothetical protein
MAKVPEKKFVDIFVIMTEQSKHFSTPLRE